MRAVVWIIESRWEDCVDAVPADADVTLVHVAPGDVEALMRGPRLGHHRPPHRSWIRKRSRARRPRSCSPRRRSGSAGPLARRRAAAAPSTR